MIMPDWVKKEPEIYVDRLVYEQDLMETAFPAFGLKIEDDGTLFAEGPFVTLSENAYRVRAYYPTGYPYECPQAVIMDGDVVGYCTMNHASKLHHLGKHERSGGVKLCLLRSDDKKGQGWDPKFSIVTVLNLAAAWLHAYEYYRSRGEWILPEAHD